MTPILLTVAGKPENEDRGIIETCRQNPPASAAPQLIELVKYPSGNFSDDVTIILAKV